MKPAKCIQKPVEKQVLLYDGSYSRAKELRQMYPKRIEIHYSGRRDFIGKLLLRNEGEVTEVEPHHHILIEPWGDWVTITHNNFTKDFELTEQAPEDRKLSREILLSLERYDRVKRSEGANQVKMNLKK